MKKLLFLFLVIPFFFACEKDDEVINVTVENPSENSTQEEFRIDFMEVSKAGSSWINNSYVNIRIVNETNKFNWSNGIYLRDGIPASEVMFVPSTESNTTWRIYAYQSDENVAPGFSRTINPTDYKDSESTFKIDIKNGLGSTELEFTISGTVLNVPVD